MFEESIKEAQRMELALLELMAIRDYKKHILDHESKTEEGDEMLAACLKKATG